jgi:hypothetical protein
MLSLARRHADTVTADSLTRELPALMTFQVVVLPADTLVNGLFLAHPTPTAKLAAVQAEMPFALTWLLESAPSYDRRRLLERFGLDTTAMRHAFLDGIQHDSVFTASLLRLATPLLNARGTVVLGAHSRKRVVLTRAQATALAARYFQVVRSNDKIGMSICAKPQLLRDRPMPRDDVVEAWVYSVVRPSGQSSDLSDVALRLLKDTEATLGGNPTRQQLESRLWRRLENEPRLWQRIQAEYRRGAAWAPVTLAN